MLKKLSLGLIIIFVFLVTVTLPCLGETQNIIKNPGFEEVGGGTPANWSTEAFKPAQVKFTVEEGKAAHSGTKSYSISNNQPNDCKVMQDLTIQPGKVYKISAWVKTDNIKNKPGSPNITIWQGKGIYTSEEIFNTEGQWRNLVFYLRTLSDGGDTLKLALRLGGQGTVNEGKVYFDDISMELVGNPDAGQKVYDFYVPSQRTEVAVKNDEHRTGPTAAGPNNTLLYIIIAGVIVIGLLVFVELKLSKKKGAAKKDEPEEDEDEI
jgi:hypothetical protein